MKIKETRTNKTKRVSVLELEPNQALEFFLKHESYCNIGLPPYINFSSVLKKTNNFLEENCLSSSWHKAAKSYEGVNYRIISNKDGKYAWRPLELVHPAIYVSLVRAITQENNWELIKKRFLEMSTNKKIKCLSIPQVSRSSEKDKAEQISNWYENFEQKSIRLSLKFEYLMDVDMADCYGSIYTHSIPWALHTKTEAKSKRHDNRLVGNQIDEDIKRMRNGQTNGIPQGSVLMDFIAEMVLGYADELLSEKLNQKKLTDFRVLRYRDDYRIFTNNPADGEKIIKLLSESAIELGLKLNPAKTKVSNEVVNSSIKKDKVMWLKNKNWCKNVQKHLLLIHQFSYLHQNSGALDTALLKFNSRLKNINGINSDPLVLIAIVSDIAFRNPRSFAVCSAIISKLLTHMSSNKKKLSAISEINKKFKSLPNSGLFNVWMQRVSLPYDRSLKYDEKLCQIVKGEKVYLWNSVWISSEDLKTAVNDKTIIDQSIIDNLSKVISDDEVKVFRY